MVREFDLETGTFVKDGFTLPRSKQSATWVDQDTLLVARDWGPGTMTTSGYPFVVKRWRRGTPLESADEVFRGKPEDMQAGPRVLRDAQGHVVETFEENLTFFESATFVQTPKGVLRMALPAKANIANLLDGELVVHLHQDWVPEGSGSTPAATTYVQGSLLSVHLPDVMRDPAHLKPAVVFAPTATEFLDEVETTRDRLVVTTLNHVQGGGYSYAHTENRWVRQALPVPANVSVTIASANDADNTVALKVNGFLTPPSLLLGDASRPASLATVKSQPRAVRCGWTGCGPAQCAEQGWNGGAVLCGSPREPEV